MAQVWVGIGSNCERQRYISAGLDALQRQFGPLRLSRVFESEAVGFSGDPFFNLVAGFDTGLGVGELAQCLRAIEYDHGRHADTPRSGSLTLDIDLLLYDDLVGEHEGVVLPRAEIDYNAFVLWPLAEVAGELCHPVSGVPFNQLWQAFDRQQQRLQPVDFHWRGRAL